jgi:type II secretory pathway pseudopilin PulG
MTMKKFASVFGVTLLEIMLVLAVAAMIIVMSVRYYQSANAAQQATSVFQQLQAIAASADSLSQGSGSYSTVSSATIGPLISNVGGLNTPWASTITISSPTKTGYNITVADTPANVCGLLQGRLQGDTHISITTPCSGTGTTSLSYTYIANP